MKKYLLLLITGLIIATGQAELERPDDKEVLTEDEVDASPESRIAKSKQTPVTKQDLIKTKRQQVKRPNCSKFARILQAGMLPVALSGDACTALKPRAVDVTMDGIATSSPLISTALISTEKGPDGRYLNLGETSGNDREIEMLRNLLTKAGMKITAIHNHWLGTTVNGKPSVLLYIHWKDSKKQPFEFARLVSQIFKRVFMPKRNPVEIPISKTTR